jgi:eukaryotic-like serine/threonine-protein kinase
MGPRDDSKKSPHNATPEGVSRGERMSDLPNNPAALVGTILSGRYLLERVLGEGGMGAVYQAEHTHMRKRLAVKVLHPEMSRMPEVVARFEREAMAAAHIDHPNIAAATDFGKTEDGSFFLVLEFVEGTSLRDRISKQAPLPVARAIHIVHQIASALQRAHQLGIVHRDLKPENVMLVDREGDPDFVKVLDFGIAKVPVGELSGVSSSGQPVLTQLGMVYGTPEYMAPEQAAGQEVDARADLYSLGTMFYELLCGVRPFDHESKVALMGMHVTAPVPRMAEMAPKVTVPPEIESVVLKLLEKEATNRFDDSLFLEVLEDLTAHYPSEIAVPTTDRPDARVASRPGRGSSPTTPRSQSRAIVTPAETGAPLPVVRASSRKPPRIAVVGASALGLGATITVAVALLTGKPPESKAPGIAAARDGATTNVTAPSSPPPTLSSAAEPAVISSAVAHTDEGSVDRILANASAALARGEDAAAISTLTPLAERYPDRVDVHRLLARAFANTGNTKESMKETETWLKLDPGAAKDSKVIDDVRSAAIGREAPELAFAILQNNMGTSGVEVLYDFAYGTAAAQNPTLSARARNAVARAEVRGRASPGLQVTLDLRTTAGCDAKRALLPRAREVGDIRTLATLKTFRTDKGCGFANAKDCYPCLHKDLLLSKTIAAIEERTKR